MPKDRSPSSTIASLIRSKSAYSADLRSASRWAAISSRRRIGGTPPRRAAESSAWAKTRLTSSAFCSPVEQILAGMSLGPWVEGEIAAMGPDRVRPAARSRSAIARQVARVLIFDIDRRPLRQCGLQRTVQLHFRPRKDSVRRASPSFVHFNPQGSDEFKARAAASQRSGFGH